MSRAERLNHLIREHRENLRLVEESEATYAAVVAQHVQRGVEVGRTRVDSEMRASTDARCQAAAANGEYYDRKVLRYGMAILVELVAFELMDGGEPC